ncbi:unnamed protein product [Adineta steineri]|uniref:ATPase AAA-type core domain-containing protein n=1 Tax=Adineta steineri TaxID=433720 RepID=A0A815IQU7_9BILA|nr:unnamed protein product [Adineta steineri]CAF3634646.1 unnamed protein product [Adineta steineri]
MVLLQHEECRTIGIIAQDEKCARDHIRLNRTATYNLSVRFNDIIKIKRCEDIEDGKNIFVALFEDTLPITTVGLYEVYLTRYFASTDKSKIYNGNVFSVPVANRAIKFKIANNTGNSYCIVGEKTVIHLDDKPTDRTEGEGLINYIGYQDIGDANDKSSALIFIDELDRIASKRGKTYDGVEHNIASQLLILIDEIKKHSHVTVITATNRFNATDSELYSFDCKVYLGIPDSAGRSKILRILIQYTEIADTTKTL